MWLESRPGDADGASMLKPFIVGTLAEKLLTFALGRGIEYYDGPAVREVGRRARAADYRFSALVLAIVQSTPFQMKIKADTDAKSSVGF